MLVKGGKITIPRVTRKLSPTDFYHIMVRGNNKENVFATVKDKRVLIGILQDKLEDQDVKIYGYCIMDNHFHILLMSEMPALMKFMAKVNVSFAIYYNKHYQRVGHVFQNRYKSECIDSVSYFWKCLRYIHLNPIKAKMTEDIKRYRYSSYNEYMNESTKILHKNAFKLFPINFHDKKDFIRFHHVYDESIFMDVSEDAAIYKKEISEHIVSEMQVLFNFQDKVRVFQNSNSREETIRRMKSVLKVSYSEANSILQELFRDV